MSKPSSADWVRAIAKSLERRGYDLAEIAGYLGRPSEEIEAALSGKAAMGLDLYVGLLGLVTEDELGESSVRLAAQSDAAVAVRMAFERGVSFMLNVRTGLLGKSGIPEDVLAKHPGHVGLAFDRKYHRHNRPKFGPTAFGVDLSFDDVIRCELPYVAIASVLLVVDEGGPPPAEPEAPEPARAAPALRLVEDGE